MIFLMALAVKEATKNSTIFRSTCDLRGTVSEFGRLEVRKGKLTIIYEATKKAIVVEGKTLEGTRRIYKRYTILLSS